MILSIQETAYRRKIKTPAELRDHLGPAPRKRKVIMCHGTFDLVHPGHVRHLMYAKSKADILIASLTCDAWIKKSNYRPFVPQDLRAMNLAALEAVDFVVIDEDPTPISNIRKIQPDYFAKGYEYVNGQIPPQTQEEIDTLAEFGGEMIFTPGDVVFSSSKFIESQPPKLAMEKLAALLNSEELSFNDLRKALDGFKESKIHVIGDTIVDSYVHCTPISTGSSKTPTLSVKFERQDDYTGGAAVVAKHLKAAGAQVVFTTVLGEDAMKDLVLADMAKCGIEVNAIIDPTRVTTQKSAFIASGYRMLKFDRVDNRPVNGRVLDSLKKALKETQSHGVVFSDFRHGIFNKATVPALTDCIPANALRVADSQVASRWGNILEFQGFDLITPNEREARFSLADQDSVVRPLALDLMRKSKCKLLILKLGERGTITYRRPSDEVRSFFTLDPFTDDVVDPVGAGDALLAYATLSLVSKQGPVIASILGSMAAAKACEHDGNWQVSPDEIREKIDAYEKRANYE